MTTNKKLEEFSRQVVGIMPLMVREFAKREENHLAQGMISCPQMVALDFVSECKRVKMTDIAHTLSTQISSASVLVDRLIREKMLERSHDTRDRRVVWIRATKKGREVLSQIKKEKKQSIKAIFGKLTEKERAQYLSVLLKVKAHLLKKEGNA